MRRFAFQLVTTLACCVVLALLLLPALNAVSQHKGELFPSNPQDYRRTDTWLGVSIIRPENWDVSDTTLVSRAADPKRYNSFLMRPYQCLTRREGSSIFVHKSTAKPDLGSFNFTETTFAGRPAWQGYFVDSHNALDYIPTYLIHVDDGGVWYTIGFSTTSKMDSLPDTVREYLDSVQFDADTQDGG